MAVLERADDLSKDTGDADTQFAQYSDSSTLTTTAILPPMLRLFLPMILR